MKKIAIMTDSNSGITQDAGRELGIHVLPMPFYIDEKLYYEDIDLTQEMFYEKLKEGSDIHTSQPIIGNIIDTWDKILKDHDEIVHIPMSSGLSGSTSTAIGLAADYNGRVQVVNNQRISLSQRRSVLDAISLAAKGYDAAAIRGILEREAFNSSIYIMVDTLSYLKKGGRVTPAAAVIGTVLRIKPVLQIQGEKLDAFAKARSVSQAKTIMEEQMAHDFENRFSCPKTGAGMYLDIAYSGDPSTALAYKEHICQTFPDATKEIVVHPLSLSISCHIGPGSLALACSRKLKELE